MGDVDPLAVHGDPGVPRLLEHLTAMVGESVCLCFTPPPANEDLRWRVWSGAPAGTGGRELGKGRTPYLALHGAFVDVVGGIFAGRL